MGARKELRDTEPARTRGASTEEAVASLDHKKRKRSEDKEKKEEKKKEKKRKGRKKRKKEKK